MELNKIFSYIDKIINEVHYKYNTWIDIHVVKHGLILDAPSGTHCLSYKRKEPQPFILSYDGKNGFKTVQSFYDIEEVLKYIMD